MSKRRLVAGIVTYAAAMAALWAGAAIWFDGPASDGLAAIGAGSYVLLSAVFIWSLPRRAGLAANMALFTLVLIWWLLLEPSNDRAWQAAQSRLPTALLQGDTLTVKNVRNFQYRAEDDFTEHWETRTYDLSQIVALDLYLVYWGSPMIAHTIMSWAFADGQHLAASIETRKEIGESYSAVRGFFRQFELYYVIADERDVIGLRTNHLNEEVYLYRLKTAHGRPRELLESYMEKINELAEKPAWYNALTTNCTTTIQTHIGHIAPDDPWSWKIVLNGHIDRLAYERGNVDTSLDFDTLRARSHINSAARSVSSDADFSAAIRKDLPGIQAQLLEQTQAAVRETRLPAATGAPVSD